jgi:hypothetical protein
MTKAVFRLIKSRHRAAKARSGRRQRLKVCLLKPRFPVLGHHFHFCLISGTTENEQFTPEQSAIDSAEDSDASDVYGEKPSKRRRKNNTALIRSEFDYVRSSTRNGREVRSDRAPYLSWRSKQSDRYDLYRQLPNYNEEEMGLFSDSQEEEYEYDEAAGSSQQRKSTLAYPLRVREHLADGLGAAEHVIDGVFDHKRDSERGEPFDVPAWLLRRCNHSEVHHVLHS